SSSSRCDGDDGADHRGQAPDGAWPPGVGAPMFSGGVVVLSRVLVANRGECAVRIVRACHDLGIEAVAVYSTADRDGLWVELADRAVCLGPHQAAGSDLNVQIVIGAVETVGCVALGPGRGLVAEHAVCVGF